MTTPDRDVVNDPERLREIADLGLAAPGIDPEFQDLAERAAARLGAPKALVSIVLDEAQAFAGAHGLSGWMAEANGTPIEWSFCAHAVRSGQPLAIADARLDARVADNPLVEEGLRCYLGLPLVTSRGHVVGTLCVLGDEPRTFTEDDRRALGELADEAMRRIEARRR